MKIIIKLLAVQLEELIPSGSDRFSTEPRPICDFVDALRHSPMVPANLPKQSIFTLIAWLGCKYHLQLLTCHDHATLLCNSFFQKIFFDLDTGFGAYPWSEKNPRLVPPSQAPWESIGKKGLRIWSLKILREIGRFPNYSFSILELLEFFYTSFECQY